MKTEIEKRLKKELEDSFDINKEKNSFLKRLYSANITPPIKIDSKELRTNSFLKTRFAYGLSSVVMSCSIIASCVSLVIPRENQSITLASPVLASIIISNDDNYDDDPEFDLTFDTNGEVTSVVAANDDAKIALGAPIFDGSNAIETVTHLVLDSARSTHYIDVNATRDTPNRVNFLFSGNEQDTKVIKSYMGDHCASYFKSNYIYANLKDTLTSTTEEEIIKKGKEEAKKYNISYDQYVLIKKIYKGLITFDSSIGAFDEDFINTYKDRSIAELTKKAGLLIRCIEKIEVVNSIDGFDIQLQDKVQNYKETKNNNYKRWQTFYLEFKEIYDSFVSNEETKEEKTDLSFISWEAINFEDFDMSTIFRWLCDKTSPFFASPDFDEKIGEKNIKSAIRTTTDVDILKDKYKALVTLVNSYRAEEKAWQDDLAILFRSYEDVIIKKSEDNIHYYEECQSERENNKNFQDKRDEEFYDEFDNVDDNYFDWQ